jgi:8-oxo-dGTP diphosphatase
MPVVSVHAEMKPVSPKPHSGAGGTIVVTAAIIERDSRFLMTRRPKGVHLEGCWEFPGGKCDPGEDLHACLIRELREELAVDVVIREKVLTTSHDYPDRRVELHFFRVALRGAPVPQLGQEMQWVERKTLETLELPPADDELVRLLTRDER